MTNLELINLLLCIGLIVSITKIILLEQEINELIVNIKILAFIIEKNKTNEVKKVKLKILAYEDAKKICEKHLKKTDYAENSCDSCPLKLNILGDFCGMSFALINKEFGDKEIVLERNDKDD